MRITDPLPLKKEGNITNQPRTGENTPLRSGVFLWFGTGFCRLFCWLAGEPVVWGFCREAVCALLCIFCIIFHAFRQAVVLYALG